MSFSFDFGKYKSHDPRDIADYLDDEFDYEYSDELFYDEDYSDEDRYDI